MEKKCRETDLSNPGRSTYSNYRKKLSFDHCYEQKGNRTLYIDLSVSQAGIIGILQSISTME